MKLAFMLAMSIGMASFSTGARAFKLREADGLFCADGTHWSAHGCPNDTSCGYIQRPWRQLCNQNPANTAIETESIEWSFWMWVREGTLRNQHYSEHDHCVSPNDWRDSHSYMGNGTNEWDVVGSLPNGWIGRMSSDSTDVCFGSSHEHFVATDLELLKGAPWQEHPSPRTFHNCVGPSIFRDAVVLHELGHAYGLGHFNTVPTIMRTNAGPTGPCNQAAGWRYQPDADAMAGVLVHNGRNSNNVANIAATSQYNTAGGATTVDIPHDENYCGASTSFSFTLMNYYATAPDVRYQFVLVLEDTPAQWNRSNAVWQSSTFSAGSMTKGQMLLRAHSVAPTLANLTVGVVYRLWIILDPANILAETDGGDNVVPTGVRFTRKAGC